MTPKTSLGKQLSLLQHEQTRCFIFKLNVTECAECV